MLKVAGVSILYNPDENIISNILSYLNQVEILYVVDNSDEKAKNRNIDFKSFAQIRTLEKKGNLGIGVALNKSAKKAIEEGYDLLLTMDQDSRITDNLVNEMVKEFEKDEKIGILAPFVIHVENPRKPANSGLEKITVAMTSGCIIRLSAYEKIGGFLEKFFIDYVDNEFCLRMISSGYKVLQLNSVYLYHKLGNTKPRNFIFKKVFPTNHSPLRWYYRTRNRLYVYHKYKNQFNKYIIFDISVFLRDFLKILLYECNKLKKIKMMLLGYRDYRKNKFGKCNFDSL